MGLIHADLYSRQVIGCAIEVHRTLDPRPLKSICEACVCHVLSYAGLAFVRQQKIPVIC